MLLLATIGWLADLRFELSSIWTNTTLAASIVSFNQTKRITLMRQTIHIANPLSSLSPSSVSHQPPVEVSLDFPLYRRETKNDNWRTDITVTRIADQSGQSISIHYLKGNHNDQETVEISKGVQKLDTGNLDLTRGVGEYSSSESEFLQFAGIAANLLANVSTDVGVVSQEVSQALTSAATHLKNGSQSSNRSSMRQ